MVMVEQTVETQTIYLSADAIPEVAELRQEVRSDAWAIVAQREQQLANGQELLVPLTLDSLSTARQVNSNKDIFGEDSFEYQNSLAGLQLDSLRIMAEWYRKLRPEYYDKVRHIYNPITDDHYSHGRSNRQMTQNGLRPIVDNPEETGRRVNEHVEQETPRIIRNVGAIALEGIEIKVRTVSECTDKAIRDYHSDIKHGRQHSGYDGYAPEIEKVMVRDRQLESGTNDILEEQVGLPGIYITHYVIQEALRRRGVETEGMDKTELHGNQLVVRDDLIDFVRLLDEVASEDWCVDLFMGEVVDASHPKDYDNIRAEARLRQAGLKDMADKVAIYLLDLDQDESIDRRKAPAKVEEFVKMLLLNECKKDIRLTTQIFDQKTADGLAQVIHLENLGRYDDATALQNEIREAAPGGGSCGGGSCGLEEVSLLTETGQELAKNLRAESGDTIVKDKERPCNKCGEKKVSYAYNKNKVNKYCGGCKAFESKVTSSKAA